MKMLQFSSCKIHDYQFQTNCQYSLLIYVYLTNTLSGSLAQSFQTSFILCKLQKSKTTTKFAPNSVDILSFTEKKKKIESIRREFPQLFTFRNKNLPTSAQIFLIPPFEIEETHLPLPGASASTNNLILPSASCASNFFSTEFL